MSTTNPGRESPVATQRDRYRTAIVTALRLHELRADEIDRDNLGSRRDGWASPISTVSARGQW